MINFSIPFLIHLKTPFSSIITTGNFLSLFLTALQSSGLSINFLHHQSFHLIKSFHQVSSSSHFIKSFHRSFCHSVITVITLSSLSLFCHHSVITLSSPCHLVTTWSPLVTILVLPWHTLSWLCHNPVITFICHLFIITLSSPSHHYVITLS